MAWIGLKWRRMGNKWKIFFWVKKCHPGTQNRHINLRPKALNSNLSPFVRIFTFLGGSPKKVTKSTKKYKFFIPFFSALHGPNWIWQNIFISFSIKPCPQEAGLSYFCPILSQIWVEIGCFWDFQKTQKNAPFWLFTAYNLDLKRLYYQ